MIAERVVLLGDRVGIEAGIARAVVIAVRRDQTVADLLGVFLGREVEPIGVDLVDIGHGDGVAGAVHDIALDHGAMGGEGDILEFLMLLFLDVVFAEGIIVGRGQAVLDIVEPTAARVQERDVFRDLKQHLVVGAVDLDRADLMAVARIDDIVDRVAVGEQRAVVGNIRDLHVRIGDLGAVADGLAVADDVFAACADEAVARDKGAEQLVGRRLTAAGAVVFGRFIAVARH